MTQLRSFHNKQSIKTKYLKRVNAHQKADEIIKGKYWEGGKGCAVGCTIHGSNHKDYEKELGLPEWLARVEDTIFEGLPKDKAKKWPSEFLKAIKVGSNLEKVKSKFIIFILEESKKSMFSVKYNEENNPQVKESILQSEVAINLVIKYHKEADSAADSAVRSAAESAASAASAAWNAVRSAADSAARTAAESAASAAWSAVRSAAWSAVRSAADSAARTAAESAAWSVAWSAAGAAWSVAWTAASASRSAAWSAARSAAYEKYADKLIELLKEEK